MKGVFLDAATIDPCGIDFSPLKQVLPQWQFFDSTSHQSDLRNRIKQAELVITNKVAISEEILNEAKQLKCICIAATGTDHVDIEAAKARHIVVCNVRNYSTSAAIQHTFGLIIALMTNLIAYHNKVQEGAWTEADHFCLRDFQAFELAGKTLGIIGYGAIGQGVAEVAKAFGMTVLLSERKGMLDSRPGRTLFNDLLKQSDVISLHCPLTNETKNLIDAESFRLIKPTALIVNTARGGVIDEMALFEALKNHRIAGAGLDVLSMEPPLKDSQILTYRGSNLIITPHVAWNTMEARQRLVNELSANITAYLRNEPRNIV